MTRKKEHFRIRGRNLQGNLGGNLWGNLTGNLGAERLWRRLSVKGGFFRNNAHDLLVFPTNNLPGASRAFTISRPLSS